jgi:hypothetical protein
LLYGLVALLFGLFLAEMQLTISGAAHRIIEIGIVLMIYSLVWTWLKWNDAALIRKEMNRKRLARVEVLHILPADRGLDINRGGMPVVRIGSIRKLLIAWLAIVGFTR